MQKRSPLDLIHALGPYLLIELLLPGGSLIAGVLYLVRNRQMLFHLIGFRKGIYENT